MFLKHSNKHSIMYWESCAGFVWNDLRAERDVRRQMAWLFTELRKKCHNLVSHYNDPFTDLR